MVAGHLSGHPVQIAIDKPAFFAKILTVSKLKRFKRIARRCDKTAQNSASCSHRLHLGQIRPHGLTNNEYSARCWKKRIVQTGAITIVKTIRSYQKNEAHLAPGEPPKGGPPQVQRL